MLRSMYNYIGMALMSVFVIMMIPAAQVDSGSDGPEFWGMGSLTLFDASGNEVFAQSIHNLVVDSGEDYIITQVFQEGTVTEENNVNISTICVTLDSPFSPTDALVATGAGSFDGDDGLTTPNCIVDTTVSYTAGVGTVTIGPLTFASGGTNVANDAIITGIGICQGHTVSPFNQCLTANVGSGILFAAVTVSSTTLGAGETVQISYTFNIA